jgi:hypothetical protein
MGEERGDGLAELLDPVEHRDAGAAQGGRVAGPGGLGAEQQVAVPVAALVARDVGGQPGPRDVLGVPQVHHPRIGQPGRVPAAAGVPDLLVDPDGIHPQASLGMGGEELGLHQPGAASTAWSGGREDHDQAGLAAVGVAPGLQVADSVQVGQGHPGRGRHRGEGIQPADTSTETSRQTAGKPSVRRRRFGGGAAADAAGGPGSVIEGTMRCPGPGAARPPRAAHAGCGGPGGGEGLDDAVKTPPSTMPYGWW